MSILEGQFRQVVSDCFVGGQISGAYFTPHSVNCDCPNCGRAVNFNLSSVRAETKANAFVANKACPACKQPASFFGVYGDMSEAEKRYDFSLFIYSPKKKILPMPLLPDDFPVPLARALRGAIDALNAGNFPAAITSGRRTLEGIFKYRVPEEDRGKKLYQLVEQVAQDPQIAEPISALSHAIRAGGNIGAHFDMSSEPTQEVAMQIVELLTYLIEFLYVLPKRIEDLELALGES